jgi:RHS repeat-associated protein
MGSATPESPSGNAYVQTIAYNTDDDGNRTSVVATPYGQSAQSTAFAADNLNRYSSVGGTSRTYDGNGNLTNDGTFKFVYNYRNLLCELRQASDNSLIATYKYDALARRVEKLLNSGSVVERYICSGMETVCVYSASDSWKQDYVFDVGGLDAPLMLQQADVLDFDADSNATEVTRNYYHRNAVGSIMLVSDASQAIATRYAYSAFGEVVISRGGVVQSTDPLGQSIAFTGRWRDPESNHYYYRARTYRPADGRFLQRDPLGYGPGANVYTYASDRPTGLVDPLGLRPVKPEPSASQKEVNKAKAAMAGCAAKPSPAECKVCCEKAAHSALQGIDRCYASSIEACASKNPIAAMAGRLEELRDQIDNVLTALGTAVDTIEIAGSAAQAIMENNAIALIAKVAAAAGAPDLTASTQGAADEAIKSAINAASAIAESWKRAAGDESQQYLECLVRAAQTRDGHHRAVGGLLSDCLSRCMERWEKTTYLFPSDEESFAWVRERARTGCPVHPNGDESGQPPFGAKD